MFQSILIANRGEIACRVIRTARAMGIRTIAVYSQADEKAEHVRRADEAYLLGPAPAAESYLRIERVIEIARRAGADAIHPGYGFLSENAAFAEACADAGIVFLGPPPAAIRAMGLKDAAKAIMIKAGVPVVPGYHGDRQEAEFLRAEAEKIGFPVLIKAVAGGGGKGMRRVENKADFAKSLESAQREAKSAFGDDRVLIEKYVASPRHIEVQVFADNHGNAVSLFERDCSVQRRHQKVIEEAPAPGMTADMRAAMGAAAVEAAKAIGYRGAGTVEFIADGSHGLKADRYYFMEMNTRLQVEHPVTEMITGQDLVAWQIKVAAGEPLPLLKDDLSINGHAIEVRLYAEDPQRSFFPSPGPLRHLRLPEEGPHIRVDTGVRAGDEVTLYYDPMIAKIIAWDATRLGAARRLRQALLGLQVAGVKTNTVFLTNVLGHDAFLKGGVDTGFIERYKADLVPSMSIPAEIYALAAIHITTLARGPANAGPWAGTDGFRVGGRSAEGAAKIVFDPPSEDMAAIEIVLSFGRDAIIARAGAALFHVIAEEEGAGVISARIGPSGPELRRRRIQFLKSGRGFLALEGAHIYELVPRDLFAAVASAGDGSRAIEAPLTGRIISILAKSGDLVRRGQALAILEAMKMEHTLAAGGDAVIASIGVAPGDQVQEGQTLITFAPAS